MKLTKFKDPLPLPPRLKPIWHTNQLIYYEVIMREAVQSLHSDMPETKIWGFNGVYPEPTIEVNEGERVFVKSAADL